MEKVFVMLADGFEEIEGLTAVDLLRRAGIETVTVSITDSLQVTGSHGIAVQADALLAQTDFSQGSMLVLPGGMPGTNHLEACEPLRQVIMDYHAQKKYLAAICAAPGIYGKLGLLKGRRAISYPSHEQYLQGAVCTREEVVCDGHFITSRGMGTSTPFGLKLVEILKGEKAAEELKEKIVYVH